MAASAAQVGALRVNLSLDSANFTQSMQSINRQLKGLESEFKATAAGNKDFEKSLDGMKSKSENLTRQFQLQEQRVNSLRDEYEQVVRAQGENSKAAQTMLTRYNNAVRSMRNTESALQDVNARIEDAENKWKQLGRAAEAASDKMKDVGGKMTAGLTAPIAAFGIAAGKMASDVDSATGSIQAKLGLTAEEAERVNDVAQSLWKNGFGEDMQDAANNVAIVSQNLKDIPLDQLEAVAAGAMTVADVMDADVGEVTVAVNRLMQDFGLSATEAFDMITTGAQTGLNKNGDLLDVLNEYSPQFKSLGFTGSEFFNTLQAGADAGAFSMDKVGDAVKEFNIRAKDGSKTTNAAFKGLGMDAEEMAATFAAGGPKAQEAFKQVVGALESVEDPVERNSIGVALFGSQFEDLESDVVTALGTTSGEFDKVAGATENAGSAMYDTFGARMTTLWRELQSSLVPIGESLLGLAEKVLPVVSAGVEKVSNIFTNMSPTMQLVTLAIGGIAAALGPVIAFVGIFIGAILNLVGPIMTAVGWLTKLGPIFSGVRTAMMLLTGPVGIISAIVIALAVLIYKNWDEIKAKSIEIFGAIGDYLSEKWSSIRDAVSGFASELAKNTQEKWQSTKDKTIEIFNSVKDFFTEWGPLMLAALLGPIGLAVYGIVTNWDSIKSKTIEIFDRIKSYLGETWNNIKDSISNTVSELRNKIVEKIVDARDRVIETISNLKSRISEIFGSMRDSITNTIGRIKENLVNGFSSGRDKVVEIVGNIKSKTKNLWDDIVTGAKELPGRIGKGISSMASNVVSGVKTMINKLASWLGKGVNGAIDGINFVLGKLKVDKIGKWEVPKYAKGTKGHPGGLAVVGDGGGEELIRTPDGKTFLSPGTDTLIDLPKGSTVLPYGKTKQLLQDIPFYKNGVGEFFSDAWESGKKIGGKVKNFALDVFDYVKNPSGLLNKVFSQFVPSINLEGVFGNIVKGAIPFIKNKAVNFVKDKLTTASVAADGKFGPPFRLSSKKGWRIHPITGVRTYHNGDDWAAPAGTPIPSQTAGTVSTAGYHPIRGNYVRVNSGAYDYIYQHNTRNSVRAGQSVSKGQTVGTVGSTGRSTGPHLHFEKIKKYAFGGIVSKPTMGLVGEAGPEGIIPLSLNKRSVALNLWSKIGHMIGALDTNRIDSLSNAGAAHMTNTGTSNYFGNVQITIPAKDIKEFQDVTNLFNNLGMAVRKD